MNPNNPYGGLPPPGDQLELNMRVIDPNWANIKKQVDDSRENIKDYDIQKYFLKQESTGKIFVDVDYLLTQLEFITRDIRLSNYDDKDIELVRWYLTYAGIMASKNYPRAFNFCIQQCAVISETSQARKGFLRKLLNTFFSEQKHTINEPGKKDFFTGRNKGEN